jgi:hypothetical protein
LSDRRRAELQEKARRWLPLFGSDPESARLLRQWTDEDLDGMPAVSLTAVKMVTGALSEGGNLVDSKHLRND